MPRPKNSPWNVSTHYLKQLRQKARREQRRSEAQKESATEWQKNFVINPEKQQADEDQEEFVQRVKSYNDGNTFAKRIECDHKRDKMRTDAGLREVWEE